MELVQGNVSVSSSYNSLIHMPLPATALPEPAMSSTKPVSELEEAAAIKLQKVYKSYRTRRNLADSAVAAEELWWKALDSATLDRSSISFFEQEKHKTATSKWTRAKVRVAKFGKGLSQNERAHKLAVQHWLEAIDPRHRYGESLHFYYEVWLESQSTQPFFYWLDVGDGKEVNLEKRTRSQLQSQCVQYLGPKEREAYEVIIEDGKFVYKKSRELVHSEKDSRLIFVMSTSKTLYIGKKVKGSFHHSSFLSGAATLVAGGMDIEEGVLMRLLPHSGHYLPSKESIKEFAHFLEENNIDLTKVTKFRFEYGTKSFVVCNSFDEDEEEIGQVDQVIGSEPGNQESKGEGLPQEPTL